MLIQKCVFIYLPRCLAIALVLFFSNAFAQFPVEKPPLLQAGDTVGLVSSGFRIANNTLYKEAIYRLHHINLKVMPGKAVLGHYSYFAGSDQARARDINNMFANKHIKGIFEIRGGWGSARMLPYLNYEMIAKNPKPIIGFSDITSLLLALYTKAHLVSFYGPMPGSYRWPAYTTHILKETLFGPPKTITLKNPAHTAITTITPGTAHGVLLGGNLSVLVSMIGTPYFPTDWHGKILYAEDTGEDVYQIDRMLTQLQQAGVLSQISGFIFGQCTHCTQSVPGSFTLQQVLENHLKPLHIPAFTGASFGHQSSIWTLPEGLKGSMNANTGEVSFQV